MKYFFQSMAYNSVEWKKDLQDCSSEWKREIKWQLMEGLWYEKKERFGEIRTDIHWDSGKRN